MAGLSRLATAKSRLKIDWAKAQLDSEGQADLQGALAELRGTDRRPLLLLRGSDGSDKKLDGLIDRSFKNEKVQLASQWFHCVRVGQEVLEQRHPLHALFRGRVAPRVVLASTAGRKVVAALGRTQQKLDWKDIVSILRVDYKKSPSRHVKELQRLLNDFDKIDGLRKTTLTQLQRAEAKGKKSQITKLKKKLAQIDKDFEKALAREKKFKNLELKAGE